MLGLGLTPGPRPRRFWRPRAIAFQWSLARPLRRMISRWHSCGRSPHSGHRITRTARHCVPSRAPSTKRGPLLPRILIQCGGGVDATGKKAVWNSHKLHRFPKANLIIYRGSTWVGGSSSAGGGWDVWADREADTRAGFASDAPVQTTPRPS
jgi:hypothetical protein